VGRSVPRIGLGCIRASRKSCSRLRAGGANAVKAARESAPNAQKPMHGLSRTGVASAVEVASRVAGSTRWTWLGAYGVRIIRPKQHGPEHGKRIILSSISIDVEREGYRTLEGAKQTLQCRRAGGTWGGAEGACRAAPSR
jgi:hypothetical protein